ncbi:hypothetical protein B0H34DRAFT_801177 [Crassisporium funariophilum]|nr:hypothetical protein B0H34DRAFT_801177 [Crassisporium funariophilum]
MDNVNLKVINLTNHVRSIPEVTRAVAGGDHPPPPLALDADRAHHDNQRRLIRHFEYERTLRTRKNNANGSNTTTVTTTTANASGPSTTNTNHDVEHDDITFLTTSFREPEYPLDAVHYTWSLSPSLSGGGIDDAAVADAAPAGRIQHLQGRRVVVWEALRQDLSLPIHSAAAYDLPPTHGPFLQMHTLISPPTSYSHHSRTLHYTTTAASATSFTSATASTSLPTNTLSITATSLPRPL